LAAAFLAAKLRPPYIFHLESKLQLKRIESLYLIWPLLLSCLVIFAAASCHRSNRAYSDSFADSIFALEQRTGGSIGVYALDTATGNELAYRADERFAMASTFKPLLVAAVLAQVDNGQLNLADTVSLQGVTIQPYSPVVGELVEDAAMSLSDLSDAAVTLGDNTAANMLLEIIGGPEALTQFLRQGGDDITRLDRYEVELNENARGDERDTTTPRAVAESLRRLLFSEELSEDSRKRLQDWMVASTTGTRRLRAGLPSTWRVGDKTGTGMNGAVNDIAVAWPPNGQPIVLAVYMSWSDVDVATLSGLHAEIAALVAASFR